MQLNGLQLAAILKAGKLMAGADGEVKDEELKVLALHLAKFNVATHQVDTLLNGADALESSDMIKVLSGLDKTAQKYVCGFLAVISLSDGDIADSELKMWKLISTLCNFPTMTVKEALEFWANC